MNRIIYTKGKGLRFGTSYIFTDLSLKTEEYDPVYLQLINLVLKSENGIKTNISQWTVKEGTAHIYKYLLHNDIVYVMLIWSSIATCSWPIL